MSNLLFDRRKIGCLGARICGFRAPVRRNALVLMATGNQKTVDFHPLPLAKEFS
jgi:hypothetical protein